MLSCPGTDVVPLIVSQAIRYVLVVSDNDNNPSYTTTLYAPHSEKDIVYILSRVPGEVVIVGQRLNNVSYL